MLRHTLPQRAYVKRFGIGSNGQKHKCYAPVPFLYRVAGKRGPTPMLTKYWHTLGCFPTGVEVPFRLDEFHQGYIREHVPEELEYWLRAVVFNPAEIICDGMGEFLQQLQNAPLPRREVLQRSQLVGEARLIHAPLQRVFDEFAVEIPVVAVRAAASSRAVKESLLDVGFAYREAVAVYGSTPHRRWAAIQSPLSAHDHEQQPTMRMIDGGDNSSALVADNSAAAAVSERERFIARAISSVVSVPAASAGMSPADAPGRAALDERLAAKLLTTLAEGCHRGSQARSNSAAIQLLESALKFAQEDADVASVTHMNLAAAHTAQGAFERGEFHAREALLRAAAAMEEEEEEIGAPQLKFIGSSSSSSSSSASSSSPSNSLQQSRTQELQLQPQQQQQQEQQQRRHRVATVVVPRAQATLAVATALRDDIDTALDIAATALQETPTSAVLQQVHAQIARAATGRVGTKEMSREKRFHLAAQCTQALHSRGGRFFDNDLQGSTTLDGSAVVDDRLSRREAMLGHQSWASDVGFGPRNTSNMEEKR